MKHLLLCLTAAAFFAGCAHISTTGQKQLENAPGKIAVAPLSNQTETLFAGQRAANMIEGVMLAKGYDVVRLDAETTPHRTYDLAALKTAAGQAGATHLMVGNVNEWRYKTGIDGEPAVSLSIQLIDLSTSKTVWSSIASDNRWGHASIGTTAQSLIEKMLGE